MNQPTLIESISDAKRRIIYEAILDRLEDDMFLIRQGARCTESEMADHLTKAVMKALVLE